MLFVIIKLSKGSDKSDSAQNHNDRTVSKKKDAKNVIEPC